GIRDGHVTGVQTCALPISAIPVLPFSSRVEPQRWARQLREAVLLPVARDVAGERRAALDLKLATLVRACRGYLAVGLQAAERLRSEERRVGKGCRCGWGRR